jgi:hypothetical protein
MKTTNTKRENQTPAFNGGSNGSNLTVLPSHSHTMNVIWGI